MDENLWRLLESKLEVLGEALNGEGEEIGVNQVCDIVSSDQSLMDEFYEKLMKEIENYEQHSIERKGRIARKKERKNEHTMEVQDDDFEGDLLSNTIV